MLLRIRSFVSRPEDQRRGEEQRCVVVACCAFACIRSLVPEDEMGSLVGHGEHQFAEESVRPCEPWAREGPRVILVPSRQSVRVKKADEVICWSFTFQKLSCMNPVPAVVFFNISKQALTSASSVLVSPCANHMSNCRASLHQPKYLNND